MPSSPYFKYRAASYALQHARRTAPTCAQSIGILPEMLLLNPPLGPDLRRSPCRLSETDINAFENEHHRLSVRSKEIVKHDIGVHDSDGMTKGRIQAFNLCFLDPSGVKVLLNRDQR